MRRLLAVLSLIAGPAFADDTTTSGMIAETGLARTAETLSAQPPSPERDMALSAVTFLAGIEAGYQARWRIGATEPLVPLPLLGTSLPPNPDPQPMQADAVNTIMTDLAQAMQNTRSALPATDAALVLDLDDLWLDVNADGIRTKDEDLVPLTVFFRTDDLTPIRFDTSDMHWLRAYTHLVEAAATLVLAFDPAPALAEQIKLTDILTQQFAQPPGQMARAPNLHRQAQQYGPLVDRLAVVVQTLRQQPDPELTRTASRHLQDMVTANIDFWQAVKAETDNDREWIPNNTQQAAAGFVLPEGTGALWLTVLDDMDQVLKGKMLVPFWRFAPGYGVDLSMWLQDPQPVGVADWVQGTAALPYLRPGLTVGSDNLEAFLQMFGGRAVLYMLLLN
ncbi:hypothetical protein [Paracoccus sp. JM45]|uniref:hypothetical protein n=1 Tax=Paracoccus sp. JM45 TaxID=2283626 RepID=UPI000E6C1355|nr:hypothetical protein [Paracoccus sp. JM45]RJE81365.1 hypothetical protein DWB67_01570 [Paracoccus sp. JM45]